MSAIPDPLASIFETPGPPDLGPTPRAARLSLHDLDALLTECLSREDRAPDTEAAFRAVALLWHDHLEESHAVSQNLPGSTGSFLHGIMHRREPDYSNAKYWFHRVGRHDAYLDISRAAIPLLTSHSGHHLAERILPNGLWDPFAFIDACAQATPDPDHPDRPLLIQVQRVEIESLVRHILA